MVSWTECWWLKAGKSQVSKEDALSTEMKDLIDNAEPSSTVYQFGGGEQRLSSLSLLHI